ncbi:MULTISPECIES: hypothetical protein [Bradyrhizobium]|uniref:Uncharacterized protein n=1 Tax=Bradyrhizobium frederickii TaxID=2560054 RepID=A0A4Y9KR66_9BRAD|nr:MULTISPECIES: hypothetical protein [Bradyrhizobium]RTE88352.1 hypothetical protein D6B98_36480 [Bradyrhizobium sp. LVM 105]TFV30333.1 hypothetical protein E4K66_35690 [Bradyrhizobium frederickii]TFV70208.1 hypothetical protein E4K64_30585 [Bradyrhizobium frederickii]
MKQERITEGSSWIDPWGQVMKTPDDVAEMLRLRACGCPTIPTRLIGCIPIKTWLHAWLAEGVSLYDLFGFEWTGSPSSFRGSADVRVADYLAG